MTALVLVRQQFWGRGLVSGVIDLPFAVSPVIAGFMLILLFGPDTLLGTFFGQAGIKVLFALPAMVLATLFVTFPFMVRELTPLLQTLGMEEEEAARTLGAGEWQVFLKVTLPALRWGLIGASDIAATRGSSGWVWLAWISHATPTAMPTVRHAKPATMARPFI